MLFGRRNLLKRGAATVAGAVALGTFHRSGLGNGTGTGTAKGSLAPLEPKLATLVPEPQVQSPYETEADWTESARWLERYRPADYGEEVWPAVYSTRSPYTSYKSSHVEVVHDLVGPYSKGAIVRADRFEHLDHLIAAGAVVHATATRLVPVGAQLIRGTVMSRDQAEALGCEVVAGYYERNVNGRA